MLVGHISDIHQGVGYSGPFPLSRYNDIDNILIWTADKLIKEKVDLAVICGDMFKDAKVMLDRASQEILSIVRFLRRLSSAGIEVIVISGTPSHDSISSYELIKEMQIPRVRIYTKPEISTVEITDYHPYFNGKPNYTNYNIACLPGLNRSMLMTQDEYKGLPAEQVHRIMTDKISMLCQGMAAQMDEGKPKILMAHMTYQNCDSGFTDLLMQNEPLLTREATAGFDLICLGHIHRPQIIDGKVFYSGPIERLSFNEEDIEPGFYIHEINDISDSEWNPRAILVESQFIETPARRYVTLDFNEEQIKNTLLYSDNPPFYFGTSIKDAIVRLKYSCSEEVAKQLNRKQLEKALYDAGCFYVSEIKGEVQRVDRARDSSVSESLTPIQSLAKWATNQGIDEAEISELQSMTEELLQC